MTDNAIRGVTLPLIELANLTGFSTRTLREDVQQGCPAIERGLNGAPTIINMYQWLNWRFDRLRAEARGGSPASDAKQRYAEAKAQHAELQLQKLRGEVISQTGLDQLLEETATEIRLQFVSFIRENYGAEGVTKAEDFLNRLAAQIRNADSDQNDGG